MLKQMAGLIGWLVLVYVAAAIAGVGSVNAPVFYRELTLPDFAPPAWWFGPVWTTLYTMMAISAWLVWRRFDQHHSAKLALTMFMVQLGLNVLWSWLFFAWYQGAIAFIEIILLWLAIVTTIVLSWRVSKLAAVLLIPYLVWVSLATALSFSIWQANPNVL